MQYSFSRVETFKTCKKKYYYRYVQNIKTLFDCNPQNALVLGTALHTGIEKDVETAVSEYKSNYPVLTDKMIDEIIKLEKIIPEMRHVLPVGEYERKIDLPEFVGFVDLLVEVETNVYDLYDFKYSNNVDKYLKSQQLHVYKFHFEKAFPEKKIRNLYFAFAPKVMIRQKKDESFFDFRIRLENELKSKVPNIVQVQYDLNKVYDFYKSILEIRICKEFEKVDGKTAKTTLGFNPCEFCEYDKFCLKGIDLMLLPENKRRELTVDLDPDLWIYGDSYVGKSTFVDSFDDLLFINTDGNTDNTSSPFVTVTDQLDGRQKKMGWEVFTEIVDTLEKGSEYKRVAVDLIEDLYEHCRRFIYKREGIKHEQDAGFGKGWDMVRTEFCSQIKRLKNLGYQLILISKESKTEINFKSGGRITTFSPNINSSVMNILTGVVDATIRAYSDDDRSGKRFLQLKQKENAVGGGRFRFVNDECPLDLVKFREELEEAQKELATAPEPAPEKPKRQSNFNKPEPKPEEENVQKETEEEKPKRRGRPKKTESDDTEEETPRRRMTEEEKEEMAKKLQEVMTEEMEKEKNAPFNDSDQSDQSDQLDLDDSPRSRMKEEEGGDSEETPRRRRRRRETEEE